MKRLAGIVAVACAAVCAGSGAAEPAPEGPTVLDVLPVVSRSGDEKVVVDSRLLMGLSLDSFTNLIATADKIVIRDGGHDCCGAKIDEQSVLLTVTNALEIAAFNARIKFAARDEMACCACCGHPGIDWWKDGRRIALTSAHHGLALRWCDFPCDMPFAPDSVQALAKWFRDHGLGDHWGK